MGFGRVYSLSSLSIGFICNAAADDPSTTIDESSGSNDPATNLVLNGTPLSNHGKCIQAIIVPDFFSVMQGWIAMTPDMQVGISGLENFTVTVDGTTQSLFPPSLKNTQYVFWNEGGKGGRAWGGAPGWRAFGFSKDSPPRGPLVGGVRPFYTFVGNPIRIHDLAGTMDFSGGDITVSFYGGATASVPVLIQTLKLHFPAETFSTPNIVTTGAGGTQKQSWWAYNFRGTYHDASANDYSGRFCWINNQTTGNPIGQGAFFRTDTDPTSGVVCDVVKSILPRHGDFRLIAGTASLDDTASGPNGENAVFTKHPRYSTDRIAESFTGIDSYLYPGRDLRGKYIASLTYPDHQAPTIPFGAVAADRPEATGDYDTGPALVPDGPYVNKADEGNTYRGGGASSVPYFYVDHGWGSVGTTLFSPNRIMPSPGTFGSLPSGLLAGIPWKTLLFRPQGADFPTSGSSGLLQHPSYSPTIPDHLLLDLFWMPVVEPYAISDPFSTAGKINLNYQIMPFSYITRSTGLWAILKSEKVGSIPNSRVNDYKPSSAVSYNSVITSNLFRLDVNIPETLQQFETKFSNFGIFKSSSEICDIHIVPTDPSFPSLTAAGMPAYWNTHQLTGDNLRERIYTTIYPRVTTKSNTYTVHYKVQVLKKTTSSVDASWDEAKDKVAGEYRGSTTIERYIDPNDTSIPDYGANPSVSPDLDAFYKWHILSAKHFVP